MSRRFYLACATIAAAAIGAIAWAELAEAQSAPPPCAMHEELVEKLKDEYGEIETDFGIVNDKAALVIFTSPEGETWTAVMAGANGRSCVITAGEHWSPGILIKKGNPA